MLVCRCSGLCIQRKRELLVDEVANDRVPRSVTPRCNLSFAMFLSRPSM